MATKLQRSGREHTEWPESEGWTHSRCSGKPLEGFQFGSDTILVCIFQRPNWLLGGERITGEQEGSGSPFSILLLRPQPHHLSPADSHSSQVHRAPHMLQTHLTVPLTLNRHTPSWTQV